MSFSLDDAIAAVGDDLVTEPEGLIQQDWRSDDAVVERCRKYVAKMPGAVAGAKGHDQTFSVACRIMQGFGLSAADGLTVLSEYNQRCDPPWSDHELAHKVKSAAEQAGERGYLADAKPDRWDQISQQHGSQNVHSGSNFGGAVGTSPFKPSKQAADADTEKKETVELLRFEAFPLECLPTVLSDLANETSESIGCDPSFMVLPMLSVCAAAIGTSRVIKTKRTWVSPSLLWTVVVGDSGSQKSPPFKIAIKPLKEIQALSTETFVSEQISHRETLARHKDDVKAWEKSKGGARPVEPEAPTHGRCIVSDSTIEALAPILQSNDRGVLLARDELSGWIASFDKYSGKGGASSDVQKWLEIYGCESITVDRKTGDSKHIFVKRPSVSICGGVQPDILSKCLTDEHKANGLQSRLLMAYPPKRERRWRDEEITEETLDRYHKLVKSLFTLKPNTNPAGEEYPASLGLDDDARTMFKAFVNSHGEELMAMTGSLASQWSKLEELPARLSILLHCIRQDTTGVLDPFSVDGETMSAAIRITEWFKNETLRINQLLGVPEEIREAQHLADWIDSRGGKITARELCKSRRDIQSSTLAEIKLIELVSLGFGEWVPTARTRHFQTFIPTDVGVGTLTPEV